GDESAANRSERAVTFHCSPGTVGTQTGRPEVSRGRADRRSRGTSSRKLGERIHDENNEKNPLRVPAAGARECAGRRAHASNGARDESGAAAVRGRVDQAEQIWRRTRDAERAAGRPI